MTRVQHTQPNNMHIVTVIPITKGIHKEQLTYFTSRDISPGSIISVPIRSKSTNALVLSVEKALLSKTQLKSSAFALKKAGAVKVENFFLPSFVNAARQSARYFAGSTGAVLRAMTPGAISEYPKSAVPKKRSDKKYAPAGNIKQEVLLVQAKDKERISTYKSIIREEFARGNSVFFCLPEISEIEHIAETLRRGIEEYAFVFHGGMAKKQIIQQWSAALAETHPVLIIATGVFLSLPRSDISTLILEKEHSRAYRRQSRPFIDMRTFAVFLAQESGMRLIMGDLFLRPETIYKQKEGVYTELAALTFRTLSTAVQKIVDMKRYTETSPRKKMPLFSEELAELIEKGRHGNENMFVLTARRGLYPFTVCRDCGRSVLCRVCSAPIVLHTKGKHTKGAMALCHKCGDRKNAADACNHCGGWRLETLGIGIQRAEEELKERFDGIRVFRIDRDTVRTHKKALEIRDMFYNTPGSILLGTEMAISYLNKEVPNVAVLSVDSLFTIPDFRINERVFGMLLRLRERAGKHFLIQTRDIDNRIFEYAAGGNMMDFYRGEIAERKILGYPPFSTLIKITVEGTKLAVERHIARAEKLLAAYKPLSFPAFTEKIKGRHRMNILLKLPKEMWIDETLLELLYSLPPSFAVRVDPEDVL